MSEEVRGLNEALVQARQISLASAFREQMTKDQSFKTPNTYRTNFYKDVTALASKVSSLAFPVFVRMTVYFEVLDSESPDQYIFKDMKKLEEAAKRLCQFVDPKGLLDRAKGPRRPLIVFAFDEAHNLIDIPSKFGLVCNLFYELNLVLQQIHKHPIFSLFVSTAGRVSLLPASPPYLSDLSNRVRDPYHYSFDPISEVSFDGVAYPALENHATLGRVVEIDWIAHLGRPLCVCSSYPF